MRVISCAGVIVDSGSRTVHVFGRMLPATAVTYDPGHEELPGSHRVSTPEKRHITELIYKTPEKIAAAIARPIGAMPEVVHFNVPCENGWWLTVALWVEDNTLSFGLPSGPWDSNLDRTGWDLLAAYDEVATRAQYVPEDEYDDPWGGLGPGEWHLSSFDYEREVTS